MKLQISRVLIGLIIMMATGASYAGTCIIKQESNFGGGWANTDVTNTNLSGDGQLQRCINLVKSRNTYAHCKSLWSTKVNPGIPITYRDTFWNDYPTVLGYYTNPAVSETCVNTATYEFHRDGKLRASGVDRTLNSCQFLQSQFLDINNRAFYYMGCPRVQ
jgi:hypothetical protein